MTFQSVETAVKRIELARELLPRLQRVALLFDPGDLGPAIETKGAPAAAARVGLDARAFEARRSGDFQAAFAAIEGYQPQALLVSVSIVTGNNPDQIVRFASNARLPTFREEPVFAEAGMLLAYGASALDTIKFAATLVDRILKGAKPADIPFQQPREFELVVNMKTANALGLVVPESIMVRATRVIR